MGRNEIVSRAQSPVGLEVTVFGFYFEMQSHLRVLNREVLRFVFLRIPLSMEGVGRAEQEDQVEACCRGLDDRQRPIRGGSSGRDQMWSDF